MAETMTAAQLRSALDAATKDPDATGFTAADVAKALGCSKPTAQRQLAKLREAGAVKPAMVEKRSDWGFVIRTQGYVWAETPKPAPAKRAARR